MINEGKDERRNEWKEESKNDKMSGLINEGKGERRKE